MHNSTPSPRLFATLLLVVGTLIAGRLNASEIVVLMDPFEVSEGRLPDIDFEIDVEEQEYEFDFNGATSGGWAGSGNTSIGSIGDESTPCFKVSQQALINDTEKGINYRIELPEGAVYGLWVQTIRGTWAKNDGTTFSLTFTELVPVVNGEAWTRTNENAGAMFDDRNAGSVSSTHVGFTMWIAATFVPGSTAIPQEYSGSGSITVNGVAVPTGYFYGKAGEDTTLLNSGSQTVTRGFTVSNNSSTPVLKYMNDDSDCH